MDQEQTICVVDDDEAVRESLGILLETMGYSVREFESGIPFLEACEGLGPGCVLLDVRMPKMSGLEVQQKLQSMRPDFPVIIVTGHGDVPMAVKAMQAGAIDFIEKPFDEEALLTSITNALSIADMAKSREENRTSIQTNLDQLTPREREVFAQLIFGHANKVIARTLDCSPRTVEIHRARVMEKMEAANVAHLVRMALAVGIGSTDI